ncbi:MAG TPA: hypothetical protein VGN34_20450, partial [Ktedonobacteraceae bacterium]
SVYPHPLLERAGDQALSLPTPSSLNTSVLDESLPLKIVLSRDRLALLPYHDLVFPLVCPNNGPPPVYLSDFLSDKPLELHPLVGGVYVDQIARFYVSLLLNSISPEIFRPDALDCPDNEYPDSLALPHVSYLVPLALPHVSCSVLLAQTGFVAQMKVSYPWGEMLLHIE